MRSVTQDVIWVQSQIRVISSELPDLLVRGLRLLFMSARLRFAVSRTFSSRCRFARSSVGAADPDRRYHMVAVNAEVLVRLTRAVLPAISPTPAPDYPAESPTTSTAIAAGRRSAIRHGGRCGLSQTNTVNIAEPQ